MRHHKNHGRRIATHQSLKQGFKPPRIDTSALKWWLDNKSRSWTFIVSVFYNLDNTVHFMKNLSAG